MNPEDYKYTKDHEWIKVEGEVATIGITNFAKEQLGDIVSVEFPKIGMEFSMGESLALIDSMKTTSDLYATVSGEIIEVNSQLEERPELMNEDPFGEGWIIRLKIKNPAELENLMNVEEYDAHIRDRWCPAGSCRALISYQIRARECTGCTLCARQCPSKAISGERKKPHRIDQKKCIQCGVCYEACKFGAVLIRPRGRRRG